MINASILKMLSQPNVDFVFRRGLVLELQQGPE